MTSSGIEEFPRQQARTRRFTLGQPRGFRVARDGSRVAFLRSRAGDDPANCLWVFDVDSRRESLLADPRDLLEGAEELSPEERARRERAREIAGGLVGYSTDPLVRVAAFPLGGHLYTVDVASGEVHRLPTVGSAFDPRLDPTGSRIAYVSDGSLRALDLGENGHDTAVASEDDPDVSWGMAEFVAAEEMDRQRGYWWNPDGDAILAARVDESRVLIWHIGDPANPGNPPTPVRYPAAGTPNADVTLHVCRLDGSKVAVEWDRDRFPYVVEVNWAEGRPATVLVQSRDQREWRVLTVDATSGATTPVWEDSDDDWLTIAPGVPAWTDDGRLVMTGDRGDTRVLLVDGEPATPDGIQVASVVDVSEDVVFTGWDGESMQRHVWRFGRDRSLERLTPGEGVHAAAVGGDVCVVSWASMGTDGVHTVVRRGSEEVATIESFAEKPVLRPNVSFLRAGDREIPTAVLLPTSFEPSQPLPVLVDPYGGPHFQRVTLSRNAHLESQWFAEQGFAVVVADGRGTPGRGVAWEKAVRRNFAEPVLEDQVDALHAAADRHPELDLSRVAIRGWSFGGELAALAVLRRPDVFHAAIAGAPVTDQRLYDTHYTERYLGHPDEEPEAYERNSVINDAAKLERPLLLIHGLADDNVIAAHTLRLSTALLEAGRPHRVLPLSGVTHMTPTVQEHLLWFELAFLREALGLE